MFKFGSQKSSEKRVYLTSLESITASSPAKANLSSLPPSTNPLSIVSKVCCCLLRRQNKVRDTGDADDEPIISDDISGSKHLQHSIMVMTENMDEHEVHCCKKDEADKVIRALQGKAAKQIDDGRLRDALHNLNESLALQQNLYGKKDSRVAATLNTMGEVLSKMGEDYRYMAMSALEESLAIRQEAEPGSEDTVVTLMNLWTLLHESNVEMKSIEKVESATSQDFDASTQDTENDVGQ